MNELLRANDMIYGLLAAIDWQPLFEDHGIPLAVMGFLVVFAALILVRIFIGSLPRIMAVLDHFYPEQEEAPLSSAVAEPDANGLPDELVAVIAAAVAATVREPHRIVHTRELTPEDMSWTLEGRMQHHASHRIRPQDHR